MLAPCSYFELSSKGCSPLCSVVGYCLRERVDKRVGGLSGEGSRFWCLLPFSFPYAVTARRIARFARRHVVPARCRPLRLDGRYGMFYAVFRLFCSLRLRIPVTAPNEKPPYRWFFCGNATKRAPRDTVK